jgi:serine/threonine protein kinase
MTHKPVDGDPKLLPIGEILDAGGHKYRVERFHSGRGLTAVTYIARRLEDSIKAIVKVPRPEKYEPAQADLFRDMLALQRLEDMAAVPRFLGPGIDDSGKLLFNVYEYIKGVTLEDACSRWAPGAFKGITDARLWLHLARNIAAIVSEVHAHHVVHADIWEPNIILRNFKQVTVKRDWHSIQLRSLDPVLIDFGKAMQMGRLRPTGADRYRWYTHWAPERVMTGDHNPRWYSPADIYSIGALLFYLAVGKVHLVPFKDARPIRGVPHAYTVRGPDTECLKSYNEIKECIVSSLRARNPRLFKDAPYVADIIMFCMKPHAADRAKHARDVVRQIDLFDPSRASAEDTKITGSVQLASKILQEVQSATGRHPLFYRLLFNDLTKALDSVADIRKNHWDRHGDREQLIHDLISCIRELGKNGEVRAVLTESFFARHNMGPAGRLLSALLLAAERGAQVNIVTVIGRAGNREHREEMLAAQSAKLKSWNRKNKKGGNFLLGVRKMETDEYSRFRAEYGSFLILGCENSKRILVEADYDVGFGNVIALRFWDFGGADDLIKWEAQAEQQSRKCVPLVSMEHMRGMTSHPGRKRSLKPANMINRF